MSARRPLALATGALLVALALAGCAASGPAELPGSTPPPAAPSAPAATPHARPAEAPPLPGAPGDTVPSPAALAVLATIPEPLGGASAPAAAPRASEPARPRKDATPATPKPAADATATHANPDSTIAPADTAADVPVPVPTPTTPLGAVTSTPLPETPPPPASAPPVTPPVATPPPAAKPAPATSAIAPANAPSDTCWRVQVGAPAERVRGSRLQQAAQSQLLVPMVVVHEGGRWKVRSKECLSRRAAESLRDRAVASGFSGVFLVRFVERP